MHVRIVRPQLKPGNAKEAAKRWEAFAGPRIKDRAGFQRGYMAATPDGASVIAVTIWDELPDEASTKQFQSEIAEQMKDIMTGPPSMEEYEILAQI